MNRNDLYIKWQTYQNYILIGIISVVSLFFLPMIGSSVGLAFILPNTAAGWIVYITSKLLVAALNVVIFHCFILQAKVNVKNNPHFIEANEIMRTLIIDKELAPRSPRQYFASTYGKKGTIVFITTVLAAIGLTQAVLTFNWISMLTYLFTILMGLIFGILQMNQTEIYWTEEYYKYAKEEQRKTALAALANEKVVETDCASLVETEHILPTDDCARAAG